MDIEQKNGNWNGSLIFWTSSFFLLRFSRSLFVPRFSFQWGKKLYYDYNAFYFTKNCHHFHSFLFMPPWKWERMVKISLSLKYLDHQRDLRNSFFGRRGGGSSGIFCWNSTCTNAPAVNIYKRSEIICHLTYLCKVVQDRMEKICCHYLISTVSIPVPKISRLPFKIKKWYESWWWYCHLQNYIKSPDVHIIVQNGLY